MIGYVWNGTAIIDNLKLYAFTDDNPLQPNTLEEISISLPGDEAKAIDLDAADFCAANGHIQYQTTRTTEPYCTTTGVDTTICAICGQTAKETTVPALGHNWPNYYNGVQKGDGVWSWACKRCGDTVSTTVPDYADELYLFTDFEDATVVQAVWDEFNSDGEVVANGVGHFENGCSQNYNEFTIPAAIRNQFTISFDANIIGTWDDDGTDSYGHGVWFWYGGDSGIGNEIGYDFDNQCFFARPWNSNAYTPITTPYEFTDGWHNIAFKVNALGEDADENYAKIYVDGIEVLSFDEWFDTAYYLPTPQEFCVIRDFGVEAEIDNFAIGTLDLPLPEPPVEPGDGDIDGNGALNIKDLRLMKNIISGAYDDYTPEEKAAADMNGDGKVNLLDLKVMKKRLAGKD